MVAQPCRALVAFRLALQFPLFFPFLEGLLERERPERANQQQQQQQQQHQKQQQQLFSSLDFFRFISRCFFSHFLFQWFTFFSECVCACVCAGGRAFHAVSSIFVVVSRERGRGLATFCASTEERRDVEMVRGKRKKKQTEDSYVFFSIVFFFP